MKDAVNEEELMNERTRRGWNVVAELADKQVPLSHGMLKLLVALERIGEENSLLWVRKEIIGYAMDETPPKYRRTESMATGTFSDGVSEHCRVLALESFMDKDEAEAMAYPYIRQGIEELESLSRVSREGRLMLPAGGKILTKYHEKLNRTLKVETPLGTRPVGCMRVKVEISGTAPAGVLGSVRTAALRIAVGLENEVPEVMREDGVAAAEATRGRGSTLKAVVEGLVKTAVVEGARAAVKMGVEGIG